MARLSRPLPVSYLAMSQPDDIRQAFPLAAAAVDLFRDLFGPQVGCDFVDENGRTMGNAIDESKYYIVSGADLVLKTKPKEIK